MRKRRRTKKKIKPITKFKIFILFILAFLIILDLRLRPIIKSITADCARGVAEHAINLAITRELGETGIKYGDIAHIERSDDGKLLGIITDIRKINCLKSGISTAILEEISRCEMRKIGIPLGAIVGIELFSGAGPIIPVKIFVTGNVETEFESEFSEAGINQTKHLIYINTSVNISAVIPGYPSHTNVKTNVTIAETIIVGEVPRVYATSSDSSAKVREAKALEGLSHEI
ncbi:MAG: sporulation protein YunB [Oscillospiraceae bacterium]|nr:sporulation protein YunB [Oscillospiraceae bacterium]